MKVYVAATRQNDGKTIVSLGLISAMLKRGRKVGYIKPVGQHYIEVNGDKIDEDSILVKETYQLPGELTDTSPVAIPRGFTENYINNPNREELATGITEAFRRVSADKDFTLIEGTGHAGVGSVFDMSNADVARLLGADVILVSAGGVGKPIDEIMLNKALFDAMGVRILGVIINKVQPEKYQKIEPIVRKGLARKGLEVLGVMPYEQFLASPTIGELLSEIDGELLSGENHLQDTVKRMVIGAMPPHEALDYFVDGSLVITPGSREDLILAALGFCGFSTEVGRISGLVLTGGMKPHPRILALIRRSEIPCISVSEDTFTVATRINGLIVKIRPGDRERIAVTEDLVARYVDIERALDLLEN